MRDAEGNLVIIQNDTFSTAINQSRNRQEQIKQLEKKKQKKAYDRASKIGFHDYNIAMSSKSRIRRSMIGLQFDETANDFAKEEGEDVEMP